MNAIHLDLQTGDLDYSTWHSWNYYTHLILKKMGPPESSFRNSF